MDFLLLFGEKRPPFPTAGIKAVGAWPDFAVAEFDRGVVGYTPTRYPGLAPLVGPDAVTLVVGDPLFDWVTASTTASGRTEQLAARLAAESLDSEVFRPFHASAIVHVARTGRNGDVTVQLRNDGIGAVSVFVAERDGFVALASSPDLIALASPTELDVVGCLEFVAQARVSAPYTLYEGVREIDPGVTLRIRRGLRKPRITRSRAIVGEFADGVKRVSEPARATPLLERHLDEFFRRMSANLGPDARIGCTLSAGLDSRTILVSALGHFPGRLTAITGAPDENPELWTARAVAERLGVPQRAALWDPELLVERFDLGRGLAVASHRRWTDAHFLGSSRAFDQSVVVGGYFSDALMDGNDGQMTMRLDGLESETIPPGAPWNVTTKNLAFLDGRTRNIIGRRADESLRRLSPDLAAIERLRFSVPAGRGMYSAHWVALGAEWAQYEPFLTESALAIAVACSHLPAPGIKRPMFDAILERSGLADLAVNPDDAQAGRSRAWLSFLGVLAAHPDFKERYGRMRDRAREILGIDAPAAYMQHLLVNVYWANEIVTRFRPGPPGPDA